MLSPEVKQGDAVKITLMQDGESWVTYGQLAGVRQIAVVFPEDRTWSYTMTQEEAVREGNAEAVAAWRTVTPLAEKPWDRPLTIPKSTESWLCSYGLMLREESEQVMIEPMDAEGEQWVEANLSYRQRMDRLEEALAVAAPELSADFAIIRNRLESFLAENERF